MHTTPQIYSAPWCPSCVSLKKWLETQGIPYHEKNVDEPGVREEMNSRTNGNQTIPTLFIGDEYWVNPSKEILVKQFIIKENK